MGLTRKQILMLSVLIFGTFVTVLNQTVVAPALPAIMAEMGVDAAAAQWLTTGFTLVNAIMIPVTAYLTDRFPTRNLFVASMLIFTCGSALAGWGPNFFVLLLGRLVQAAGAGILMPMGMTVLMLTFPVEKRGTAMGLFGVVIAFAPAIGPTIAGLVIDQANWHIMFWGITVLSALVVVAAALAVEKTPALAKGDIVMDKLSVVLSSVGFGALLYGFSTIGSVGVDVYDVAVTLVGAVALVFFVRRQLHLERPMLRVDVLKNRKFLIGTVIGMIVQSALLAVGIMVPIYVQSLLGLSATMSGLILMPGAIIMGVMGPIAGRLFDRYGPRILSIVGTGVLTATSFVFAFFSIETSVAFLTVVYTIRLFSLSLVNMPITTWAMNSLDDKVLNHGTSVNNTLRQVAGSLGTAIVISVYTTVAESSEGVLGWAQANMFGIDVAFAVSGMLCLIAFVMVVLLVRDRPGDANEADSDNARKSLLETIMKDVVYSVPETATVSDAVRLFVDKGISAAPIVTAKGQAIGFISDGDVMRALSKRERTYMDPIIMIMRTEADGRGFDEKLESLMDMNVKRIGAMGIVGVDVHADLADVCRVLGENRLKKVPVTDEGRIVGMINRSDITQYAMKMYLERHS